MKTYMGIRNSATALICEVGGSCSLPPRLDLVNHSPTGFGWGYLGSGPSQLSLAILADALEDDQRALRLYQLFKFRVVARWDREKTWSITVDEVREHVAAIEKEAA